jgi:hypothetical protein
MIEDGRLMNPDRLPKTNFRKQVFFFFCFLARALGIERYPVAHCAFLKVMKGYRLPFFNMFVVETFNSCTASRTGKTWGCQKKS